jgi:hypothetical protein
VATQPLARGDVEAVLPDGATPSASAELGAELWKAVVSEVARTLADLAET